MDDAMLKLKAQIMCGDEIAMGPGKALLLEAIAEEGSITAAAKAIGMSYRRAWLLVDAMNRCWAEPVVDTAAGGAKGGGTRLTVAGETILSAYRALDAKLAAAARSEAEAFARLLRAEPLPPGA
ncbi:winged helix-turn-helix domain-containing protein [Sphingomonas abietis]|uniref:LysR family transcriptional regulator n=1 Tax=Sphingomonas abietis TaxID=3012344 RepID=A0ABY7NR53_9SPHN|nr:LysR family transcriptional regulator [Sphingomonas abietis]WBO24024.1 LysR family transcriptional regulator [Sphingomonas abietis]